MTPEPFLFGILTVLGSYLLAVTSSYFQNKRKDPLRSFKPFNLKNHGSFFQKNKRVHKQSDSN